MESIQRTSNELPVHVVQVGTSGFPYGMAEIEKIRLLGKCLSEAGAKMTIISQKGVHDPERGPHFSPVGQFEGMDYHYASGSVYRPKGFLRRNLLKLKGWWGEAKLLRRISREKSTRAMIVHTMDFLPLLFYWILGRRYRFTLLYLLVEHNSKTTSRQNLRMRISDFFLENLGFKMVDGVLPISHYLIDLLAEKAPGKPYLTIPVLTEFARFERPRSAGPEKFFLYCGSVSYLEVILFVLDAFEQLPETAEEVYLYLVIGGDAAGKAQVAERIATLNKRDHIRTFSNLPYDDLVQLYVDAIGLLIPLRHTLQDVARFPHKIGEYLASGNPLITTKVGEVPYYFTDGENALITEDYRIEEYVEKMQLILDHPKQAREIGETGKEMGKAAFDYPRYGPPLLQFINYLKNPEKASSYVWNLRKDSL